LYYAFTLCARNLPAKLEIYGLATLKLLTDSERYSDLLGFKNESIATQQLRKKGKGSITQARYLRPCNVKLQNGGPGFSLTAPPFFNLRTNSKMLQKKSSRINSRHVQEKGRSPKIRNWTGPEMKPDA